MIPREQVCQGMVTSAEPEPQQAKVKVRYTGSGLSVRGPLEPEACLSSQVHELLSLCTICSQWAMGQKEGLVGTAHVSKDLD